MANLAPMLSTLGYDPYANPPNYGSADALVKENSQKVLNILITFKGGLFTFLELNV